MTKRNGGRILNSFTTVYSNVGSYRRPPPLSRLGTGTGAALHGCAMYSAAQVFPAVERDCLQVCN